MQQQLQPRTGKTEVDCRVFRLSVAQACMQVAMRLRIHVP